MGQFFIATLKWLFLVGEMPEYPWCRGCAWRNPVSIKPLAKQLVVVFFKNEQGKIHIRGAVYDVSNRFVDAVYGNKFDYEILGWLPFPPFDLSRPTSSVAVTSIATSIRLLMLVTALAAGIAMIANSSAHISNPEELFVGAWLTISAIFYIVWAFANKKLF